MQPDAYSVSRVLHVAQIYLFSHPLLQTEHVYFTVNEAKTVKHTTVLDYLLEGRRVTVAAASWVDGKIDILRIFRREAFGVSL